MHQPSGLETVPLNVGVLMPGGRDEVGTAVLDSFQANGCQGHALSPEDNTWPAMLDFIVIYGPMQPLGPSLARIEGLPPPMPCIIVWYTEPLPSPHWPLWPTGGAADLRCSIEGILHQRRAIARLAYLAGRLRCVGEMRYLHRRGLLELLAVFTPSHQRFFEHWNLPVATIPMGYHPGFGERLGLTRDIDVVFLGSTRDKRRRRIVGELQSEFAKAGITFVLKDGSQAYGSVFGADRARLLNRAKIMLNIMRQPWDDPVFRLLLTAPNGAMVLSEPVRDAGPFEAGIHFASTELANMVNSVRYYLQSEERQQITESAWNYVTRELTMQRMAGLILETWQGGKTQGTYAGRGGS